MSTRATVDTFLGPLEAVADGGELTGLYFPVEAEARPSRPDGPNDPSEPLIAAVTEQLAEYAAGRRREFDLPLRLEGTPFQRAVWAAIQAIPFGETISYRTLAERVGSPRGVRAVGAATGRNPIPVIVPCHRVVGSDGSLTGYGGGLERKRLLLELEGWRGAPDRREPAGFTPSLWEGTPDERR